MVLLLKYKSLMKDNINILVIDDYEMTAEGIISRIKKVFPKVNCYYASNVRSAYAALHHKMDLIICDLEFEKEPEHDGFFIIKNLLTLEPRTKAIALTHFNSYRIMKKTINSGFLAFLNKGCSFQDFSDTLHNVLKNGRHQSKSELDLLKKRMKISRTIFNESIQGIADLSIREIEITLLSIKTIDVNRIANLLQVKPSTVITHFKNIRSKLKLSNNKELSIFALDFKTDLENELKNKL